MLHRSRSVFGTIAAALVMAACSEGAVSAPEATLSKDIATNGDEMPARVVTLCKIGPAGTNATFSISATPGGTLLLGNTVTVAATSITNPTGCVEVWKANSPASVPDVVSQVTITEIGATPGTTLMEIVTISDLDGSADYFPPTTSATVRVSYYNGAIVFFKNTTAPVIGFRGCTPGYWKQSQHFDSWVAPYVPNMQFSAVFADAFPGKTLLQVLGQGGGGLKALGRHTVAALLSSSALGYEAYGMTPSAVVTAFNAAYASGNYGPLHTQLEGYNERGCPLN